MVTERILKLPRMTLQRLDTSDPQLDYTCNCHREAETRRPDLEDTERQNLPGYAASARQGAVTRFPAPRYRSPREVSILLLGRNGLRTIRDVFGCEQRTLSGGDRGRQNCRP